MRIVPEFLLPQPHHHLGNMYQYSNQVIYTKLQHCDTLSAVFAHVASRLATTDYHRSTQTARATVKTSKKVPLEVSKQRIHSGHFGSSVELAAPKSRLVVACGARKAGVSSPYG